MKIFFAFFTIFGFLLPHFVALAAPPVQMTPDEFGLRYTKFNVGSIRHLNVVGLTTNQVVMIPRGLKHEGQCS